MWGRKDREDTENPAARPASARSGDRPPLSPAERSSPARPAERQGAKPPAPSSPTGTRIGNSMNIKGEITAQEDVYLDGIVKGSVKLERGCLTIGVNGAVEADVNVRTLVLLGGLKGKVHVAERIEIRKTGSFEGDIVAGNIVMEEGAVFSGSIDIIKPKRTQATAGNAKPGQAGRPASAPKPAVPKPAVPKPAVPKPNAPKPNAPKPATPKPGVK